MLDVAKLPKLEDVPTHIDIATGDWVYPGGLDPAAIREATEDERKKKCFDDGILIIKQQAYDEIRWSGITPFWVQNNDSIDWNNPEARARWEYIVRRRQQSDDEEDAWADAMGQPHPPHSPKKISLVYTYEGHEKYKYVKPKRKNWVGS